MEWADKVALVVKNLPANAGDIGGEAGLIPREGNGNSLQYSYLENPTDRAYWQAVVHRVTKGLPQLK